MRLKVFGDRSNVSSDPYIPKTFRLTVWFSVEKGGEMERNS
jgi:hypothetical protein